MDEDTLPYPKPLARSAFLTPEFDPTTFLSSLHNRHQTLEDLRTELRTRSQELNKELLDLVNENYQDFLSLGSSLQGGDEKVEEVTLGLLGFKRDVEGLKAKVEERRKEVDALVNERKGIRQDVQVGRTLLEIDQRLGELEKRLIMVPDGSAKVGQEDEDIAGLSDSEDENEEEEQANVMSASRLQRHAQQYLYIKRLMAKVGAEHSFSVWQEERVLRMKQTVLLDLGSALKQTTSTTDNGKERLLKILRIYGDMDEPDDALKLLNER